MKKIAYIEIDTHAEVAQDFIEIMQDSDMFDVDYYFSEKIKNQVKDFDQSIFLSDSSMILEQLKKQKYDLIIIGTVHRFFNTFQAIAEKYDVAVIAHNLNFMKASKWSLFKSIFKGDVVYRVKLLLKEGLFNSSKAYEKAKNLLVLDEELESDTFKFLPLVYSKNFKKSENTVLTVVIPGGVSQKRRDYKRIFSSIRNWENSFKKGDQSAINLIEFVFLGKVSGNELSEITDLGKSLEYVTITYFTERVSQNNFGNWMQKADILWCPIQQETEFFSQKEIYGITKMTGNINDAIKYSKMAVFPENYSSKLEFIIPEQENLLEQFKMLQNAQFDFQKSYNKESVQQRLEKVLTDLISI